MEHGKTGFHFLMMSYKADPITKVQKRNKGELPKILVEDTPPQGKNGNMIAKYRREDGSYIIPLELPEHSDNKNDEVDDRNEMVSLAKINGLIIDDALWGYRIFHAILVPGTEEEFRAFISEEDRRQKAARIDGRCIVPDGNGGVKRCPERLPNPYYAPETNPGVTKTIANKCVNCVFFNLDLPDYSTTTFSALERADEDDDDNRESEIGVGIITEEGKYVMAGKAVMDMMKEKHKDRAELMELQLKGKTRKKASDELGVPTSTAYNMPEDLRKDLWKVFDNLCFINHDMMDQSENRPHKK